MAILKKDEIMQSIRDRIGADTSDEALAFIENIEDTLNDYENKTKNDGVDWREKYEQNDAEWRKRYRERFFSGSPVEEQEEPIETPKRLTFEQLFKEE